MPPLFDGSAMSCECPGEEEEPDRWFYPVGKVFVGKVFAG